MNRLIAFLIFSLCSTSLLASDTTIVLQQNVHGYAGCVDTYLYHSGLDTTTLYTNYSNEVLLLTAN